MDSFLIDYLRSGKAWVLVGSGPSIEMGYPSWKKLASFAVEVATAEGLRNNLSKLNAAMVRQDFPMVFEEAKTIVGGPRLRQYLQDKFRPSNSGRIYEMIARWPIPVYMTTNYDDEIQVYLAKLGQAYQVYCNSEDHLSYLLPEFTGGIIKLHGDLNSERGLILTASQYREIEQADSWRYWRTKMTSVFQMNRVVVIGHSLSDSNIRHVLEAAKQGSGVLQPICWIAPDVSYEIGKDFLEKYRIRVISYDNRDGEHRNLFRLIETINDFIPPRTAIHIQQQIAEATQSPLGKSAAAPGFYVFNKLSMQSGFEEKRVAIVVAAIQSVLPKLTSLGEFNLETALESAGWPRDLPLESEFSKRICSKVVEQKLLIPVKENFKVGSDAESLALDNKKYFEHVRDRFKQSLVLRIRRNYPAINESDAFSIASDIEASLTGYFREGGLSLATTLFSSAQSPKQFTVPSSVIKFATEASAQYDDLLKRQAFCTVSVDAFVKAEPAERDYLGRISQGFFAFHALGVFGDVAVEKLKEAEETVWLIDSNVQISALALAAPTNAVFKECFSRLKVIGLRFFTTQKLFEETYEHLQFADKVIKDKGATSPSVIAAAIGQLPYRKSNKFLEGFIQWQSVGNPCDWESYLFQIFGNRNPKVEDIKTALCKLGIEVIALQDWHGFSDTNFAEVEEYAKKIQNIWESKQQIPAITDVYPYKKAQPEAEALIIVKREREGCFYILSNRGQKSSSWFISDTSILNIFEPGTRITWHPDAFLKFASTIFPISYNQSVDNAFDTLLWQLAQSGLSLLDEKNISTVFGGIINQDTLNIIEQRQIYKDTLEQKYGESLESVMGRVPFVHKHLVAIQLANEMAQEETRKRQQMAILAEDATKRARNAEKKLEEVEKFRQKMEEKQRRNKRKERKQQSKKKKKNRNKKRK